MSRDPTRPFGVLTMMVTMLLGMNGRLEAGVFAREARCAWQRPDRQVRLPPGLDTGRRVPAARRRRRIDCRDRCVGGNRFQQERVPGWACRSDLRARPGPCVGRDDHVRRDRLPGGTVITLENTAVTDAALGRVRGLFASSAAVRGFRALDAAVEEEDELTSPERLAVRLTGALVAQLDGDEGAVGRLARQLRAKVTGPTRKVRTATPDCWAMTSAAPIRAANDLERCDRYFSIWDPRRQACSFVWTLQVEGAWFGYLSCSSVPLK